MPQVDFNRVKLEHNESTSVSGYNSFKWGKEKAELWQSYTAPSRPAKSELEFYERKIKEHFGGMRGLYVLVLGSTAEFRKWLHNCGCYVTVMDKSKGYYEKINELEFKQDETKIIKNEKAIFEYWHKLKDMNEQHCLYDVVIGDLAIGNVMPNEIDTFIQSVFYCLKPYGIFIGKNLFTGVLESDVNIEALCDAFRNEDDTIKKDPYGYLMYHITISNLCDNSRIDYKKNG